MLRVFSNKDFNAKLKKIMFPVAFQTLMLNAVNLGDTLMLGLVNQGSIAAVSLASQVYFVMTLFIGTLTGGATVLAAQYLGKRDFRTVESVFSLIVRYAALVSAVFFCAGMFAPEFLMRIFTAEPELIRIGAEYLKITSISYLFAGVSQCYLCMLKINDRAKQGSIITTSIVFLDLVLNAIFIFGLFGAPAMGAKGAALTTSISKGLEILAVLIYSGAVKNIRPRLQWIFGIKLRLEKEFWKYSYPVFLNSMAWGGGMTVYSMIIGHLGTEATAANSIVTIVKNLIICISEGLGVASGILVGKTLGENDLALGKAYGSRLSQLSVLCGFLSAVLVILCGPVVITLFKTDETTNMYILGMLVFCAVNSIARCINETVICGLFSAGGDTKFDAQSLIVTMWGIIIPAALCAAFWWRLPVIWVYCILSMDEPIKIPWVYARYKQYRWVTNITKEQIH